MQRPRGQTRACQPEDPEQYYLDDWVGEPDPRVDDWNDDSNTDDDKELDELAADIGTILAGRTVVPAVIMWWRTRRERRAEKEGACSTTEQAGRSRWFEI
jgi:hypothetical protein